MFDRIVSPRPFLFSLRKAIKAKPARESELRSGEKRENRSATHVSFWANAKILSYRPIKHSELDVHSVAQTSLKPS